MRALFIVLDTVRRDYLECYGNGWVRTPSISRIARDGVVFDNHWAGSLPCMPARREFMTGRYNFLFRGWGPIEPFDDVLPVWLRKRGVFSHILTDHDHYFELGGENYHTAFDTWEFFRGQEHDPWASIVDRVALPEHLGQQNDQNWKNRMRQQREEEFSGPRTCLSAIEWLEANRNADGWFLQLELFDPHEPFYCTDEYREMYGDTWEGPLYDWPDYRVTQESPEAIEHIRKCYAGLLTMTDRWVGRVLDKVQELGLWDDLLIVFTTDHGTMLAEHGYWMKNYMPVFNEIARIPLVVKLPGNAYRGTRVSGLSQTIDLMPTFLDLMGAPIPPHVHGRSLRPLFEGGSVREDGLFGYFGMAVNVTDGRHVYMRNPVNDDAGPLHAYTAMPVHSLNRWYPREVYDRVEMGRYFGHTYNLPLYKIPDRIGAPIAPDHTPIIGRHDLFDVEEDPHQERPIDDPALEREFVGRMVRLMKETETPGEQFERLGLSEKSGG